MLAAVSGGADSVALVHVLAGLRARSGHPTSLAVGHVNHKLRGRDSEEDAAFVRRLAVQLKIPYYEAVLADRSLPPTEDRLRRLRYRALAELAARAGAGVIALAHTADDQAETVLFRMARGAGVRGLAGMGSRAQVQGARVIRPLLDASRQEVLAYLHAHGLSHREDASNATLVATRNFLRHEVLPRIRERINPSIRETLVRQADLFRELDGYLEAEARRVLPELLVAAEEGKIVLDATRLVPYPKLLRSYIFRCALNDLDGVEREVSAAHVHILHSLATHRRGRSADFPMGIRAKRERGRIILTSRKQEPAGTNVHPTVETFGVPADSRKGSSSA